MRGIHWAKQVWALEAKKISTDTPTDSDLFGAGKYIQARPACPASGTYQLNVVVTKPVCNIIGHSL